MKEDYIDIPLIDSKSPFSVYFAGFSYCDKSYRIYRPNSQVACVEYILSGKGTLITQGKIFYPKKGDTYICYPDDTHEYYSDADEPWIKIWFNAKGPLINQLAEAYGIRNRSVFSCNSEDYIKNIHSILQNKFLTPQQMSEKTAIIFHRLVQFLSSNTDSKQPYTDEAIILKNYIDNHLCSSISINKLCSLIYKSPTQTIRIFKKNYNITPYDYHINNKLRKAISLLEVTNLSIKEISFYLGFCDEHYFSNLFKQKKGMTPSEYRNQLFHV